jgi:polar amino acid transport system substrate-binding protein
MKLPTLDGGQTLLVGLDDAPPKPMQFGNPENGTFKGYEVDVLEELARRTATSLRYRRALWSRIVKELASGNLDIICSAATITPERVATFEFCRPHLEIALAVVRCLADTGGNRLTGERVGVREATTAEAYVKNRSGAASVETSESNDSLYAALKDRRIAAVVDDSPIAKHFSQAILGLRLAGTLPDTKAAYGIMVRKGNIALRDHLDRVLLTMEEDGTLRRLQQQWIE